MLKINLTYVIYYFDIGYTYNGTGLIYSDVLTDGYFTSYKNIGQCCYNHKKYWKPQVWRNLKFCFNQIEKKFIRIRCYNVVRGILKRRQVLRR